MVSGANTAVVVRVVSSTDLDSGPADAALVRLMEAGWAGMDAGPFLLHLATPPVSAEQDRDRHAPILERLQAVIERGQREGDIAPDELLRLVDLRCTAAKCSVAKINLPGGQEGHRDR